MRVLLVVKSKMMENLGVMYLSSVIKKANHECKIVSLSEAKESIHQWGPEIIGFSIMTGDKEKFKQLKEDICFDLEWRPKGLTSFSPTANPRPKFIVGGPDPTFFPEGYDWADEIVKGEGENIIDRMINFRIKENGDEYKSIDSIPWPDRTDFPDMKIRDFITSRGCPYKCTYCYNAKWAEMFPEQRGIRVRSVDDVIAEIKSVNPEYVYFQDSCFGIRMEWFAEFSKRMRDEVKKPYQCNFRPEQITDRRAYWLRESGCVAVRMALETSSDRLRELVGRNGYELEDVMTASNLLRKYGIQYMIQNIIGLPTSTIEEDLQTLEFNIQCKPTYSWVSIYQPYPGTALGDLCKEKGWYKGDYSDITDSFFDTSFLEISPEYKEQLEVLQKVWALCVDYEHMPKPEELTYKALPKLIHTITRRNGDKKLYLELL